MAFLTYRYFKHIFTNISLIFLSLILLPLDTSLLVLCFVANFLTDVLAIQRQHLSEVHPSNARKTILVTGVGMTKGLVLARLFHLAGHRVIGADFRPFGVAGSGSVSKSLAAFYPLRQPNSQSDHDPYVDDLVNIVSRENVDLWVSCSGVASAVEDGEAKEVIEAKTPCLSIQFDSRTTRILHEKDTFIQYTKSIGLHVPETHTVTDHVSVETVLKTAPKDRKFIMKPIGVDDRNRGNMTLLPRDSQEETSNYLSDLDISRKSPWILQQFIQGNEYCTHALVIRGEIKAFVACPSAELLMHYEALPFDSRLSQSMLRFSKAFAQSKGNGFTGHLSFDFLVETRALYDWDPILYPIECNPRVHTAIVLFNGTSGLAQTYLSFLDADEDMNASGSDIIVPQENVKYYWIGHDLVALIRSSVRLAMSRTESRPLHACIKNVFTFIEHCFFWKDGTFVSWDPLPSWWLYHCYWPMLFLHSLLSGTRWSRINISTNKVFAC